MKVVVGSLAIGEQYRQSVALCTASLERYCSHNGYPLCTDADVYDPSRPCSWSKVLLLQKHLPSCDFFAWVDADTLITNDDARIEDFVALMGDDKVLLLGRDQNNLNMGVAIFRNHRSTFELLRRMWDQTDCINHPWWEQQALIKLYDSDPQVRDIVAVIPQAHVHVLNAYESNHCPASLLMHFAGAGMHRVAGLASRYAHLANRSDRGAFEQEMARIAVM